MAPGARSRTTSTSARTVAEQLRGQVVVAEVHGPLRRRRPEAGSRSTSGRRRAPAAAEPSPTSPLPAAACSPVSHSWSDGTSIRARRSTSQPSSTARRTPSALPSSAAHATSPGRAAIAAGTDVGVDVAAVEHRSHHRVLGRQLGGGAEPEQQLAGAGVAAGEGGGVRRAPGDAVAAADLGVRVDAVLDQQLRPGRPSRARPPRPSWKASSSASSRPYSKSRTRWLSSGRKVRL